LQAVKKTIDQALESDPEASKMLKERKRLLVERGLWQTTKRRTSKAAKLFEAWLDQEVTDEEYERAISEASIRKNFKMFKKLMDPDFTPGTSTGRN